MHYGGDLLARGGGNLSPHKYQMRAWIDLCEARGSSAERYVEAAERYLAGVRGATVSLAVEDDYEVAIQRLYVYPEERRTGLGSGILRELCRMATKRRITLFLEALPEEDEEDNIDLESLVAFYQKFGFHGDIRGDSAMMYREP